MTIQQKTTGMSYRGMTCASVGHHRAHMSGFSQIILLPLLPSAILLKFLAVDQKVVPWSNLIGGQLYLYLYKDKSFQACLVYR